MTTRSPISRLALGLACAGFASAAFAQTTAPSADDGKAHQAIESAFKKADANSDGKLSRTEAAKMPAAAQQFDRLDQDKDGALTLAEFAAGFGKAG